MIGVPARALHVKYVLDEECMGPRTAVEANVALTLTSG